MKLYCPWCKEEILEKDYIAWDKKHTDQAYHQQCLPLCREEELANETTLQTNQ